MELLRSWQGSTQNLQCSIERLSLEEYDQRFAKSEAGDATSAVRKESSGLRQDLARGTYHSGKSDSRRAEDGFRVPGWAASKCY